VSGQLIRQPMFNIPNVIVALVAIFILIFYAQSQMDETAQMELFRHFAFVPVRISNWLYPNGVVFVHMDADSESLARFFIGEDALMPWTALTYAFLHGSWTHVLFNSLWLMSFGAAVARRLGTLRFLVLCGVTAVAGAAMHFAVYPLAPEPVIGLRPLFRGVWGRQCALSLRPGRRWATVMVWCLCPATQLIICRCRLCGLFWLIRGQ